MVVAMVLTPDITDDNVTHVSFNDVTPPPPTPTYLGILTFLILTDSKDQLIILIKQLLSKVYLSSLLNNECQIVH